MPHERVWSRNFWFHAESLHMRLCGASTKHVQTPAWGCARVRAWCFLLAGLLLCCCNLLLRLYLLRP